MPSNTVPIPSPPALDLYVSRSSVAGPGVADWLPLPGEPADAREPTSLWRPNPSRWAGSGRWAPRLPGRGEGEVGDILHRVPS